MNFDATNFEQEKNQVIPAPRGKERLKWLGPAFIWMLSAAGSGELLFTPRIAAQYGYSLVWALVLAVVMKWFINREIGRFTVCTGATFFRGLSGISTRSRYLLWFIVVPQLAVAIATIAGLAGGAATALVVLFKLPMLTFVVPILILTTAVISLGQYKLVERVITGFAIIISLAVLAASLSIGPDGNALARGFIPAIPAGAKVGEILPWLGFMLAGAAGLMWFSYWIAARGYGAAHNPQESPGKPTLEAQRELERWIRHMTIANTLAVVGALIIAFAFLILGTELLKPQNLLPEENKVAETLGKLLEGVWGRTGFWFMILAVFITFVSTILADQDGFGRMFSDGTMLLTGRRIDDAKLRRFIVIVILGILPLVLYAVAGEPVGLLKIAGAVEACHIPVVTALILYLNHKTLPRALQPSRFSFIATCFSGLTFFVFAMVYLIQLFR